MTAKSLDRKNRWRSKTVSFRVSPEEDEMIETFVRLSGLSKQDYIISRLLEKDIVVVGNTRVYKALRNKLASVLDELKQIASNESPDDELIEVIKQINDTMYGLVEERL